MGITRTIVLGTIAFSAGLFALAWVIKETEVHPPLIAVALWAALVTVATLAIHYQIATRHLRHEMESRVAHEKDMLWMDKILWKMFCICKTPQVDAIPNAWKYREWRIRLTAGVGGVNETLELLKRNNWTALLDESTTAQLTDFQWNALRDLFHPKKATPVR